MYPVNYRYLFSNNRLCRTVVGDPSAANQAGKLTGKRVLITGAGPVRSNA